ncbi:immunity protein Tsi6 family protein [Pseudomonas sp. p1(2021b)]|uniref:immunity protein Tsi6 family protein n=1 Tax=Pseudomonas sp. p1(2021b) TaxID=2874628 RepID=UPI001CCA0F88|nr:immunity protein Tsi6 family protein [Pseudomonas sp. p1(2021b)]UBM23200.1 immunity protein Tsi6 family protein [Pseudomonas sp. p1(2021b)]
MKLTTPLAYVQNAIDLTMQRNEACPSHPLYGVLLNQLDYVKAVFGGHEQDKSKLHQLSIGAIASKEFEEHDPELAVALKNAYYVAIQSARGLKIQLPD